MKANEKLAALFILPALVLICANNLLAAFIGLALMLIGAIILNCYKPRHKAHRRAAIRRG